MAKKGLEMICPLPVYPASHCNLMNMFNLKKAEKCPGEIEGKPNFNHNA